MPKGKKTPQKKEDKGTETLWCEHGKHNFERALGIRGRKPKNCPEHQAELNAQKEASTRTNSDGKRTRRSFKNVYNLLDQDVEPDTDVLHVPALFDTLEKNLEHGAKEVHVTELDRETGTAMAYFLEGKDKTPQPTQLHKLWRYEVERVEINNDDTEEDTTDEEED